MVGIALHSGWLLPLGDMHLRLLVSSWLPAHFTFVLRNALRSPRGARDPSAHLLAPGHHGEAAVNKGAGFGVRVTLLWVRTAGRAAGPHGKARLVLSEATGRRPERWPCARRPSGDRACGSRPPSTWGVSALGVGRSVRGSALSPRGLSFHLSDDV